VQPEDFKRAIERSLELHGFWAPEFGKIDGADSCVAGKTCKLDTGILVDRAARTVTFNLTASDADFLAGLSLPGAFAVPAGTPAHEVGTDPLPATGPYRIAAYDKKSKLVRLVRNRKFKEWSRDAQPDGFPGRISFSWSQLGPTVRLRAVERGRGDIALGFNYPRLSKRQFDDLRVRYSRQLRVNTSLGTSMYFLNLRLAPFNDLRVRRAVNIAFDRDEFARETFGGLVEATCRYLPPNIPGYRPGCPYGHGGATALDAARRLVRNSGTIGTPVAVWTFGSRVGEGHYIVSVLDSLGYRARLKVVPDEGAYFNAVFNPRTRAQTGYITVGWEIPSAANVLWGLFSCKVGFPWGSCDPAIDAQMTHAGAVQVQDPPAALPLWHQVEQSILAKAPVVPTYVPTDDDFVSKRVGNYEYNLQSGVLLDQLWVR
jgi:peptide/nickel transport system substrate-binding protein